MATSSPARASSMPRPASGCARCFATSRTGRFAFDWIAENEGGKQNYDAHAAHADLDQPIEKVGARLRTAHGLAAEPAATTKAA